VKIGVLFITLAVLAHGAAFTFSTGGPTNSIASASRPDAGGKFEIESADDFVTTFANTNITGGSFYGLLVNTAGGPPAMVNSINVEIYRVFSADSDVNRTSGPPTFSTPKVPTRVNSPSDVAFDSRDSAAAEAAFTVGTITASFTALNSIQPGGIHPLPNILTGGNGAIAGTEVLISFTLTTPFSLPADHYFFVPQVDVSNGEFYWLSGTRPISGAGTTPFAPDLQSWTRDSALDPDWLRIGTDIVGAGTFNGAFTLEGVEAAAPEPGTLGLLLGGMAAVAMLRRRLIR